MGFFTKNDSDSKEVNYSVVAKKTKIIGAITNSSNLHIDGTFEGVIYNTINLTIGKSGEVIGEIYAENIIVSGLLDGKIECDNIQILNGGKVVGELKYNDIKIENDAKFEGKLIQKQISTKSKYFLIRPKFIKVLDYINERD